ncbi:hypothetical protein HaLaN_15638 [Haematococcus lacustris]|uniref:Uncharacterized protein n=1 Tax=Haematococcus lacustris TaxID=44745 RepID=A0A699Z9C2_HAELA|nr:hypothetical protein HaLaN_15638 [Haematococcus lacustris]
MVDSLFDIANYVKLTPDIQYWTDADYARFAADIMKGEHDISYWESYTDQTLLALVAIKASQSPEFSHHITLTIYGVPKNATPETVALAQQAMAAANTEIEEAVAFAAAVAAVEDVDGERPHAPSASNEEQAASQEKEDSPSSSSEEASAHDQRLEACAHMCVIPCTGVAETPKAAEEADGTIGYAGCGLHLKGIVVAYRGTAVEELTILLNVVVRRPERQTEGLDNRSGEGVVATVSRPQQGTSMSTATMFVFYACPITCCTLRVQVEKGGQALFPIDGLGHAEIVSPMTTDPRFIWPPCRDACLGSMLRKIVEAVGELPPPYDDLSVLKGLLHKSVNVLHDTRKRNVRNKKWSDEVMQETQKWVSTVGAFFKKHGATGVLPEWKPLLDQVESLRLTGRLAHPLPENWKVACPPQSMVRLVTEAGERLVEDVAKDLGISVTKASHEVFVYSDELKDALQNDLVDIMAKARAHIVAKLQGTAAPACPNLDAQVQPAAIAAEGGQAVDPEAQQAAAGTGVHALVPVRCFARVLFATVVPTRRVSKHVGMHVIGTNG